MDAYVSPFTFTEVAPGIGVYTMEIGIGLLLKVNGHGDWDRVRCRDVTNEMREYADFCVNDDGDIDHIASSRDRTGPDDSHGPADAGTGDCLSGGLGSRCRCA